MLLALPFRRSCSFTGDCRAEDDSPSGWAPPLGEAVAVGVTRASRTREVDGLDVVAPDVTGDPVAYGLAVRVGREVGDALPGVGRGETVAAGDALAVCAE